MFSGRPGGWAVTEDQVVAELCTRKPASGTFAAAGKALAARRDIPPRSMGRQAATKDPEKVMCTFRDHEVCDISAAAASPAFIRQSGIRVTFVCLQTDVPLQHLISSVSPPVHQKPVRTPAPPAVGPFVLSVFTIFLSTTGAPVVLNPFSLRWLSLINIIES